jgi:hypothetical protein
LRESGRRKGAAAGQGKRMSAGEEWVHRRFLSLVPHFAEALRARNHSK